MILPSLKMIEHFRIYKCYKDTRYSKRPVVYLVKCISKHFVLAFRIFFLYIVGKLLEAKKSELAPLEK